MLDNDQSSLFLAKDQISKMSLMMSSNRDHFDLLTVIGNRGCVFFFFLFQ